jgi:hypothetical protein
MILVLRKPNSHDMSFRFCWESNRSVYVQFSGDISEGDLTSATDTLYHDPRSDLVREVIWDFSGIDNFEISPTQVEVIAASDTAASSYMRSMKAAFVICHPELIELAKNYIATMERLGSPWQNRLFASEEDARRWLSA